MARTKRSKPDPWLKLADLQAQIALVLERDPKAKWRFVHGEGVYSLDFKLSRGVKMTHEDMDAWQEKGICSDEDEMTPADRVGAGFFILLDDTFGQE